MRDKIVELHLAGKTGREISKELGVSPSTITYNLNRRNKPYVSSAKNRYDWSAIREHYINCGNVDDTCSVFGVSKATFYKKVKQGKLSLVPIPLDFVLKTQSRGSIKRKLLADNILKNVCSECGQEPLWRNRPLVMVLDHKNGINTDNRLDNLRLLCPNCNSQTETFAGKNAKRLKIAL